MMVTDQQEVINKAIELKNNDGYIDTVKLANLYSIDVIPGDWADHSSAYIKYDEDTNKFTIFVNTNHSKERQRFSIAHELAHYLLHQDIVKEKKQVDRKSTFSLSPLQEKEADQLASEILMPKKLIEEYFSQHGISRDIEVDKTILSRFARAFNVSLLAAYIKLKELNYNLPYNI